MAKKKAKKPGKGVKARKKRAVKGIEHGLVPFRGSTITLLRRSIDRLPTISECHTIGRLPTVGKWHTKGRLSTVNKYHTKGRLPTISECHTLGRLPTFGRLSSIGTPTFRHGTISLLHRSMGQFPTSGRPSTAGQPSTVGQLSTIGRLPTAGRYSIDGRLPAIVRFARSGDCKLI